MNEVDFFKNLLSDIDNAYQKSGVYREYGDKNWGYNAAISRFVKKSTVIIGFNGGVDQSWTAKGNVYGPQKEYPIRNFAELYDELGSLKRVVGLFQEFHPEANKGVQINYCFFRSEGEGQITWHDLELCAPIFKRLIEYLEPNEIITFSRSLHDYFSRNKLLDVVEGNFVSNNRSVACSKGNVKIGNKRIPYSNLPHPNYPITTESRRKAWKYCFS
ncbi:MAG: hypothetical protein DHS20C17_20150 [Cyclobacteriaceae bacterium]|nr:MAG: hypothetical protein DHS20C17_20150 [Cyclobacteriaceae bacterium]